jgi:hypothetical protein
MDVITEMKKGKYLNIIQQISTKCLVIANFDWGSFWVICEYILIFLS